MFTKTVNEMLKKTHQLQFEYTFYKRQLFMVNEVHSIQRGTRIDIENV